MQIPRPPFTAAIFDMDGLLVDSERVTLRAWLDAARARGIALAEADYLQVVGRASTDSDAMLTALLGGPQMFEQVQSDVAARLWDAGPEPLFPLKPGAASLLHALRQAGVPCAVASSSRRDEIEHRLGRVDVLQHFHAWAGGNEVQRGKPDPALYQLAAARLGVDPAQCLAFEDSENGARAAQAAGVAVVIVPDLKAPGIEVVERSHGVLESLVHPHDHLPRWFRAARVP
ncbi:HAD family phosphatase [Acidovorax sp. D2M1]|uniref:HAD family phosphatase n=1 Tax=Acidovorax benzenivorans TaxID=2987520 RepID=A0ABT5RQX4_9BURK|nr:HAD family phosphatase [Acidovorax benzenivorans]MDD2176089.1 HAD family phosphatase [Acidovorax benzenivorans]